MSRPAGHPITLERAKELLAGDLGDVYREILAKCCAPIYWFDARGDILNSGTLTFARTPGRLLGITAAHVIRGFLNDKRNNPTVRLQVMNAEIGQLQVISISDRLDLVTIAIDDRILEAIGTNPQPLETWPPLAPQEGYGIMFAGFPGHERREVRSRVSNWGLFTALGIARIVTEEQITWVAPRGHNVQVAHIEEPPPNYALGGISGGPLIGIFETPTYLAYHVLSGIVSQSHDGLENVVAKRADFIQDNGVIRGTA